MVWHHFISGSMKAPHCKIPLQLSVLLCQLDLFMPFEFDCLKDPPERVRVPEAAVDSEVQGVRFKDHNKSTTRELSNLFPSSHQRLVQCFIPVTKLRLVKCNVLGQQS